MPIIFQKKAWACGKKSDNAVYKEEKVINNRHSYKKTKAS
jgi:hypothetical protein